MSDVANALYTLALDAQLAGLLPIWRARHPNATLDDEEIRLFMTPCFWLSFGIDFVTNQTFASPFGYQFPPRTQRPKVTGYDERMLVDIDQERSLIFCASLRPLLHALDSGVLSAFGQKDPVQQADQTKEAVPYSVFDDGNWYLTREKSRLHVKGWRRAMIESSQDFRHGLGVVASYRWTELRLRTAADEMAAVTTDAVTQASMDKSPKGACVGPDLLRAHLDEVVRNIYERSPAPKPSISKVWDAVKQTSGHKGISRDRVKVALDKVRTPVRGRPKKRQKMPEN